MPVQSIVQDADQAGVPIREAAILLGVTAEAIRKRIRRKTLRAYKAAGHWYVVLPKTRTVVQDASRTVILDTILDGGQDVHQDDQDGIQDAHRTELVARLEAEVAFLRRELDNRTEEIRRRDAIITTLIQRPHEPSPPRMVMPAAPPMPTTMPDPTLTQRQAPTPGLLVQWWRRLMGEPAPRGRVLRRAASAARQTPHQSHADAQERGSDSGPR